MAMGKSKPGIDIVFGMGKPGKGDPDAGEEHAEASDVLKDALVDAGMDKDAVDTVLDALHSYVEACIKSPPPKDEDESEDY